MLELAHHGHADVTPTLHYAMSAIDLGAGTASELAQALAVTKQAAAKTVSVLLARGYIDIDVDPDDRRRKRLRVTVAGHRVMQDGAAIFDTLRENWAEQAGKEAVEALEETLRDYTRDAPIRLDSPGWSNDV
ncbi:MarR family winged helix-turn-helix transcriptional regulator [Herbiconiux sp. L3-i23]|uniref:MarR family winged helix-turn-helix transcriptional regulator n=1 Tax=Herbiconiux sp. L3-i23 TaxID=2905871 RepID=UPI00207474BC|nr:MarR family winged helix-turn-helix transcriptional regulator [Herbiconiux sp. L3-i23]